MKFRLIITILIAISCIGCKKEANNESIEKLMRPSPDWWVPGGWNEAVLILTKMIVLMGSN